MDLALPFHARLTRDPAQGEMRDGSIRYLMMRPDALMGLFARLDAQARKAALAALSASVAEFGGRSVAAYRASGAAAPEPLMRTIAETSAALGWGCWSFAPQPRGAVEVRVENSPFASALAASGGSDCPCCAPIVGILSALAPVLAGDGAVAREVECGAVTAGPSCRFLVEPKRVGA
ncbi:hypothetical protein [Xanthobacter agilis]|uniref:hypothetical protein n=1 Tax=Xanthobacter agilis TaxID=47492 RepID=UPI003729B21C